MTLRANLGRLSRRRSVGVAACVLATAAVMILGVVVIGHRQAELATPPPEVSATSATAGFQDASRDRAAFHLDVGALPDGLLPARSGNTVLTAVEGGHNAWTMRVVAGQLRHGEPVDTDASSMLLATLPTPVTSIGVTVRFPAYGGSVAMEAWQDIPADAGRQPAAGIHVVVGPGRWEMSVWDPVVGRQVLAGGTYVPAKPDTAETFEVTRTGADAVLRMPDGAQHFVSDPRIASWAGANAAWELYEYQPGIMPASIDAIWAS